MPNIFYLLAGVVKSYDDSDRIATEFSKTLSRHESNEKKSSIWALYWNRSF